MNDRKMSILEFSQRLSEEFHREVTPADVKRAMGINVHLRNNRIVTKDQAVGVYTTLKGQKAIKSVPYQPVKEEAPTFFMRVREIWTENMGLIILIVAVGGVAGSCVICGLITLFVISSH